MHVTDIIENAKNIARSHNTHKRLRPHGHQKYILIVGKSALSKLSAPYSNFVFLVSLLAQFTFPKFKGAMVPN